MSRVGRARSDWTLLIAAWIACTAVVDALLLQRAQTFFTAGFNAGHARGLTELAAFFGAGAVTDLWLALGIAAVALPLAARFRGTEAQRLAAVWLIALAVPFTIDFVRYRVGRVVGVMADVPILLDVSGGALRIMLAEAALYAGPLVAVLVAAGAIAAGIVFAVGRVARRGGRLADARRPSTRAVLLAFAASSVLSVACVLGVARTSPNLWAGLSEKPSGWLVDLLIQRATDVDFDGFGVLSQPPDPAPFDGSRNAFAIDVAGNGVDEDGLAGDLPKDAPLPDVVPLQIGAEARHPDVLLVLLESFRADLLERERGGREITPFLNALAREGASSRHAYVHSPYTLWSRAQLFGGALVPRYGQRTLVDDFRERGYTVALFSGQDDSFGRSPELVGRARADFVYDARQDADRRTSRSASAASLQVSADVVLERVGEFLASYDASRPLFLYVNFVDTHFPYTHAGLDEIVASPDLSPSEIRPENAERVFATYENTAANVDRSIGKLVDLFRRSIGGRDHAILVVSDHGQGFYENGYLGHGQALTDDQTRTPFIIWGIGGSWPEPLGMADVRGLLQRYLFLPYRRSMRARFVPDPNRRVLHFMARIDSPRLIGLRKLAGLTTYDFGRGTVGVFGADGRPKDVPEAERDAAFRELVHVWEATRAAQGLP